MQNFSCRPSSYYKWLKALPTSSAERKVFIISEIREFIIGVKACTVVEE